MGQTTGRYITIVPVLCDSRSGAVAALFLLLVAIGCGSPDAPRVPIGPGPVTPPPPPPPPVNNPPRVLSLTASADRIEVGEEVTLTATVLDDESSPENLIYEWKAVSGSFTGTGRVVKWRASLNDPAIYKISLVVIDKYIAGEQALEHRVTAESSEIRVDDSPMTALSREFIRDFANSTVSPQTCVRNFSDSCSGKQEELEDIIDNRRRFVILAHTFAVTVVDVNAGRTRSTVSGPCEFRSRELRDGSIDVARGRCELTLIYKNNRWWLCESRLRDANSAGLHFPF